MQRHALLLPLLLPPALAQGAAGAEIRATPASLLAALSSASGGDVVVLGDGDYGSVVLSGLYQVNVGDYAAPVRVVAAHPGGARFEGLELRHAGNLVFEGLAIAGEFRSGFSRDIALLDSRAASVFLREDSGVVLRGNHVEGGGNTLSLLSVAGFSVTGNTFARAARDLIQISRDSHHGLVENNLLLDTVVVDPAAHPDMIQIYGLDGETPHDITIRGNHLYDDPATGLVAAQGIFLCNPTSPGGFRDILIEQNLVSVRHVNSVYIDGGQENVVIRDNSLIAGPEGHRGGTLRLAERGGYDNAGVTATGNILRNVIDETGGSSLGDNLLYATPEAAAALFAGTGRNWRDFLTQNPAADTYGANEILAKLAGR